MSFVDGVKESVKESMKSGDVVKRDILRVLLSDIGAQENTAAQGGKPLTMGQIQKVIAKLIAGNTETLNTRLTPTSEEIDAVLMGATSMGGAQMGGDGLVLGKLAMSLDDPRRAKLEKENQILESLLPKSLTEEEIAVRLESLKTTIKEAKSVGQATGLAMKVFKDAGDTVDGNVVKTVVEKFRQ